MARVIGANAFGLFLLFLMAGLLSTAAILTSRFSSAATLVVPVALAMSLLVFLKTEIAIYLLIFSMLLSPEYGAAGMTTGGATLGRGVTFRFDDLLLLIVGIAWLIKSAIHKDLGILRRTPLNGAMLFYIFACTLATLIGVLAGRVELTTGFLFLLKYTQYFMLFFMIVNNIRSETDMRRYWRAVVITALIVATLGIAQIPSGQRVTAPFEGEHSEPNTFGGYLGFLILICVALAFCVSQRKNRLLYLGIALYLFIPFLFTLSRASYLGFVPGLAVILFLSRYRVATYIMVIIILLVALFPTVLPQAVRARVAYTWSQEEKEGQVVLFGRRLDTSSSARLSSFGAAVSDFWKKPLFGYGITGWHFIDSQYFRTLVETGLVGFMAFSYLLLRILLLAVERWRDLLGNPFYRGLATGFLGGFVSLLFHAIGANTFIIVRIMEPFWLVAAIIFMASFTIPKQALAKG